MEQGSVRVAEDAVKPWLFLDVDGVCNAVRGYRKEPYTCWPTLNKYKVTLYEGRLNLNIRLSPELAQAFIDEIFPRYDVVWLTSWGALANEHISPLMGWPQFPVAAEMPHNETQSGLIIADNWKLGGLRRWYEKDPRPFAWIDDELSVLSDDSWIDTIDLAKTPYLLIQPEECDGISPAHIEILTRWAEEPEVIRTRV